MNKTGDTITIRPARLEDRDAVLDLQHLLFPGDPNSLDRDSFAHVVENTPKYLLVAENEGKMAGFLLLRDRGIRPWTGCDFVGVSPEVQGRGLGRALVQAALRETRRPLIRLFVRPSNKSARKLYNRLGFVHISTRKANYDDGEDALVLMRWSGLPKSV